MENIDINIVKMQRKKKKQILFPVKDIHGNWVYYIF